VNMGWGLNWRSDSSIHNCSISCALGLALMSGCSRSFEHIDFLCLESGRGWGVESSAIVG
jgi:hypothetical protein